MAFPLSLSERVTALESHVFRQDEAIRLAQDGLALLSEDGRALQFRTEVTGRLDDLTGRLDDLTGRLDDLTGRLDGVTGRLDQQGAILAAIAAHLGIDVPPAA